MIGGGVGEDLKCRLGFYPGLFCDFFLKFTVSINRLHVTRKWIPSGWGIASHSLNASSHSNPIRGLSHVASSTSTAGSHLALMYVSSGQRNLAHMMQPF